MQLVIPLLNNGDYEQLRFALRSITAHHQVDRCILVGGKPKWYTGDHIPHKDYGPVMKEENIRDKTLLAASTLTGPFMFANDDHILFEPITKTYNKGLISESLNKRTGQGTYTKLLQNTLAYYGDVPNVDCHCPMMMDSEGVKLTNFDWPVYGLGFKTCYSQENNIESEFIQDCKEMFKTPTGRLWFSMAQTFNPRQLLHLFPNKSIFEL